MLSSARPLPRLLRRSLSSHSSHSSHHQQQQVVRSTAASGSMVYESERAVHEYLLTHYGSEKEQMPFEFGPRGAANFPKRCAEICARSFDNFDKANTRALDVGCATGGQSFQLAKYFKEVVGVDFSKHFVDAANEMKSKGEKRYEILKQGTLFQPMVAKVQPWIDRSRVSFHVGDACNLDKSLGEIDR